MCILMPTQVFSRALHPTTDCLTGVIRGYGSRPRRCLSHRPALLRRCSCRHPAVTVRLSCRDVREGCRPRSGLDKTSVRACFCLARTLVIIGLLLEFTSCWCRRFAHRRPLRDAPLFCLSWHAVRRKSPSNRWGCV